ncbi:MAG: class II fumarate hydratase [Bacteroidales bacterium]|nr:class II fumarate hydratase [Bacteroidales bacterium]
MRIEKDSMGDVEVPLEKLWGAQTQRSYMNFKIGEIRMPLEMIRNLAIVKKAAACANAEAGVLSEEKKELIATVCDEIVAGKWDDQFPLVVWQTGSGTQTNMNVNEVIAHRAEMLKTGSLRAETFISPNDDVNKSQSTNDVFPTAMRMAVATRLLDDTLPALSALQQVLSEKAEAFQSIIKIGRTHMQDATPVRLGSEFSAYAAQISYGISALERTLPHLMELPLGGTAVGTGLNTPAHYDTYCLRYIRQFTGKEFTLAPNKFEAISSHDALVETSGAIKQLAVSLMKIANDIRLSASGPRSGIGELLLPQNEPGSSIMPGKVNPTQCEAVCMVCAQLIGMDTAVSVAGMQGHWQLNVFMPMIAYNLLLSVRLLADVSRSFAQHCISGIMPNEPVIQEHLNHSLMLVTALNPHIGYHNAAKIAQYAYQHGISLKEAALALQLVSENDFDRWVDPEQMV